MHKSANDSPRYRKFTGARNAALEVFHVRAQVQAADILSGYLTRILEIVSFRYRRIENGAHPREARHLIEEISRHIELDRDRVALKLYEVVLKMRRNAHALAYVSEAEALSRATGVPKKAQLSAQRLQPILEKESPSGGQFLARIDLALDRIRRNVVDALQLSRLLEDDLDTTLKRIGRKFPPLKAYKRPPRTVRKLREADIGPRGGMARPLLGFIDDDMWQEMVNDYTEEYIPVTRAPEFVYDVKQDTGEYEEWYGWEIEQEITNDFVTQVRGGQVQAAKENGVTDFVWIAILDSVTDTCCRWRHALTSQEILDELGGKHSDDECRASVPPAHFNCRCDLAPMVDMPEETPPDFGEFETWLNEAA